MHHPRFGAGEFLVLALIAFFAFLFFVYPWWRIFSKAGYPGVLSLLYFVPGVNVFLIFWFAFADWPALRNLHGRGVSVEPWRGPHE